MNKAKIIEAMAKETGQTKKDSAAALDAFINALKSAVKKGDTVTLTGIMTVSTAKRKARTGRNPQTGQEIKIPARTVVKFKPGKELRDIVA